MRVSLLLRLLLTIWLVITIVFFALRIIPGDAIRTQIILGGGTVEDAEAQRLLLGLERPIFIQYVDYLGEMIHGDFGVSLSTGLPVVEMVVSQLPSTLSLALGAIAIAIIFGVGLGGIGALIESHAVQSFVNGLIIFILSTPLYLTAPLLISLMAVQLNLFPATGTGGFKHLVLPISALGFHLSGAIAQLTMKSLNEVKQADFIRYARAKGLPVWLIWYRHLLRLGLLPVLPVIGLQLGFVLSGMVITESIFVRQGIGRMLLNAVVTQDYPLIQGVVVFSALFYGIINIIVDTLQTLFDPRLL